MRIAEIYRSIQGEGLLTGCECVFVRASGCNLRCWFCDTPYTSWQPEGRNCRVDEIVAEVRRLGCNHVVITGGEPMLFADLGLLTEALHADGRHLTIETAGTVDRRVVCDLMSISPKLSNSVPSPQRSRYWARLHQQRRDRRDVVARLMRDYPYQLKFVVDSPADCDEVQQYLQTLPGVDRQRVLLMPQGVEPDELADKAAWLEPYCQAHGLRYCARKQIEWFGLVRGT